MDERSILDGCKRGDKSSWDAFVDKYSKILWWSIHETLKGSRFYSRPGLAEEIFQELFSKIFAGRRTLDLRDPKCLPKYLMVAACRVTLDKIKSLSRSESRTVSLDDDGLLSEPEGMAGLGLDLPDPSADEAVLRKERNEAVSETIESLTPLDRAVVEYHFYDEKTHREIGLILGMPQDSVSSVVRRAKEKLKQLFIKKGLCP